MLLCDVIIPSMKRWKFVSHNVFFMYVRAKEEKQVVCTKGVEETLDASIWGSLLNEMNKKV